MQIGVITLDGFQVGVVLLQSGELSEAFVPNLEGYEPEGRAEEGMGSSGRGSKSHTARHGPGHHARHAPRHGPGHYERHKTTVEEQYKDAPKFEGGGTGFEKKRNGVEEQYKDAPKFEGGGTGFVKKPTGRVVTRGSAETEHEIEEAAKRHGLDPNFMKGVASIESDMRPSANANNTKQYKGLYQMGSEEWNRFGRGKNIYSARDNAEAAAAKFEADAADFKQRFGRDPTDAERYMIHQQGMGHFTRGALTNVRGNAYPGMSGEQTPESFREGWGRELERRKANFTNLPNAPPTSEGRGSANYMHGQHGAAGENLTTIKTSSGKPVTVHQAAAKSFEGFLADLEKTGYQIDSVGGYNYRNIAGSNRLSQHAYGNAIDINPAQNPQYGGTNLPADVSEMAAKHGLSWGGDWSEKNRDPMHFEWTGKPTGDGEL